MGVGVAHGMDSVQGGAGCEAGVSHPGHQVSGRLALSCCSPTALSDSQTTVRMDLFYAPLVWQSQILCGTPAWGLWGILRVLLHTPDHEPQLRRLVPETTAPYPGNAMFA